MVSCIDGGSVIGTLSTHNFTIRGYDGESQSMNVGEYSFCALTRVEIFDDGGARGWPTEGCYLSRSGNNWTMTATNNYGGSPDITRCEATCF